MSSFADEITWLESSFHFVLLKRKWNAGFEAQLIIERLLMPSFKRSQFIW